jgi:uncharacterized protein DUF4352/uncharacterized protein DUF2510
MADLSDLPPPEGSKEEGYYPDPLGGKRGRWWDGSQWTTRVGPKMDPGAAPARAGQPAQKTSKGKPTFLDRVREAPTWVKIVVPIVGLFVVIGALSSPEEEENEPGPVAATTEAEETEPSEPTQTGQPTEEEPAGCGTEANSNCTPHVGPEESVRVDALIWQVTGARTATTLGDSTIGLDEQADGVFVVVDLKARSDKDESVTLTDTAFQLEVGGNTYDTDSDGTFAAIGTGDDPLFFEDIGPDATIQGPVVFDVPANAVKNRPEMRFNELGFGSSHAYISLPAL